MSGFVVAVLYCLLGRRTCCALCPLHFSSPFPYPCCFYLLSLLFLFFSFTVGLWPLYGFLSVLVVGVLFMGAIMVLHFIPTP